MTFIRSESDIHTLPQVRRFRDELRKNLTPAEASFWNIVKNSRLDGRKFRRQHSIGNYIFDFYSSSEKLAIELDGEGHFGDRPTSNDRVKREFAESHGIRVLRFENELIYKETNRVLNIIRDNFGWLMRAER